MTPTIETSLWIAGIGMVGIFIFMALFYALILALSRFLPYKEEAISKEFVLIEDEDTEME